MICSCGSWMAIISYWLEVSYLVKVEHQVQFANIVEVLVQYFDKVMNSLQVAEIIVINVYADTEVQSGVPSVDYLEISKLKEINNVGLLNPWMYIIFKIKTSTKFVCLASLTVTTAWTSSISFCFSSSSKFMYHFARRVLPALFWIRINRI